MAVHGDGNEHSRTFLTGNRVNESQWDGADGTTVHSEAHPPEISSGRGLSNQGIGLMASVQHGRFCATFNTE